MSNKQDRRRFAACHDARRQHTHSVAGENAEQEARGNRL